jgi:hypothetical protein
MKRKLCKITVKLDETAARWARIEAARRETSVSRFLGKILEERMLAQDGYDGAMRRALARRPFPKSHDRYLSREAAHERNRLS